MRPLWEQCSGVAANEGVDIQAAFAVAVAVGRKRMR
jgi:hypothetical protein